MIQIKDIYWAAGFIDGEGSSQFTKSNSLVLSVPQKSRELLDRLVELFGGAIYPPSKSSVVYTWQLGAEEAAGVMMTIYSIMSNKRQNEFKIALFKWKNQPFTNSKYIEVFGKCKNGHEWIEENIFTEKDGSRRCKSCLQIRSKTYSKKYYLDNMTVIKERSRLQKLNKSSSIGV